MRYFIDTPVVGAWHAVSLPEHARVLIRALLAFIVLVSAGGVWAMLTGGGYTLYPSTITYGGGVNSIGGGYNLSGSMGDSGGVSLAGGGYTAQGGLWQIIAERLSDDEPPPGECPATPPGAPPLRPLVSFPRPTDDGQYRIILWNAAYQLVMFDIIQTLSAICDAVTCTIIPDATLLPFGLINGDYGVYIQHQPDGAWVEAATFAISHPAPALVDNISAVPNQGRPTITWTADSSALYFQLFVGRLESGNVTIEYLNWIERTPAMCCGATCTFKPEIYPPGGDYVVYMQAWGPGGFSSGGLANLGWNGPGSFMLPSTPPNVVTNLMTANENTGNPTFIWQGSPGVTWYQFWMGTLNPLETALTDWYLAESLGCENAETCVLTPENLNLPNGTYNWYVRGWGPGGLTQGGVEGWAAGNEFTVRR